MFDEFAYDDDRACFVNIEKYYIEIFFLIIGKIDTDWLRKGNSVHFNLWIFGIDFKYKFYYSSQFK